MKASARAETTGQDPPPLQSLPGGSTFTEETRVLVFTTNKDEEEFLCSILRERHWECAPCADFSELREEIKAGAAIAVVQAGALDHVHWPKLQLIFTEFPNFPLIILAETHELEEHTPLMQDPPTNVLLLERHVAPASLFSAIRRGARLHQMHNILSKVQRQETTQMKEDLLRERAFSDLVINSLPGIFYAMNKQGRVLRWNKAVEKVTGYSTEEVAGMNALQFFAPEHRDLIAERIRHTFEVGESTTDVPILTKSGLRIPYFFSGTRCMVDNEPFLLGMGVDVTEQKRTEQRLREARDLLAVHSEELEKRVAERTRNLQASIQALEGVLYHVAHDLRAPLRTMQGFTTILMEEASELKGEGMDYARRIAQAASRMDKLIQDLLVYGRMAHQPLQPCMLDLNKQLEVALNALAKEIKARRAVMKVQKPLLEVYADPSMLGLLLMHLLSNAINFVAPDVRPIVHVRTEQISPSTVRISVQDNGIGISPEHHDRIFRVFERLEAGGVSTGTGIGLAIVKKGVERMGGTAGLESRIRHGSRFWLDLPAAPKNE